MDFKQVTNTGSLVKAAGLLCHMTTLGLARPARKAESSISYHFGRYSSSTQLCPVSPHTYLSQSDVQLRASFGPTIPLAPKGFRLNRPLFSLA